MTIKGDNKGFSLIEVLVAVSVLAIVFVPVIRSFTTASLTNSRAQSTQDATSLADEIMEKVKATSIETLINEASSEGTTIGSVTLPYSDIDFTGNSNPAATPGDFQYMPPYTFVYHNVTATQGRTYDATVTITTDEYGADVSTGAIADASDANTFKVPQLKSVDSSQHAVLSWEINNIDKSAIDRLVDDNALASSSKATIKNAAKSSGIKTTTVTIAEEDSKIKITCTAGYDANTASCPKKVEHITYTGYFDDISSTDTGGPNVYLFYSTIRGAGGTDYFKNEKIVVDDKTTGKKHNVYLILQGSVNGMQDVTDMSNPINISMKVTEHGIETSVPNNPTTNIFPLTGSDAKLYTNIRYGSAVSNTEFDNVVNYNGGDVFDTEARDRIYYVTVSLTKHNDPAGEICATLTSTMNAGDEAKYY